jgi:hypothetical protein
MSFTPRPLYSLEKSWEGPEPVWTLWSSEKSLAPSGNGTPVVQPVASRYID